jgi:hypothetical protein
MDPPGPGPPAPRPPQGPSPVEEGPDGGETWGQAHLGQEPTPHRPEVGAEEGHGQAQEGWGGEEKGKGQKKAHPPEGRP